MHVDSIVNKVALRKVFPLVLRNSPVNINPPCTILIRHRRCIHVILVTDSVVKHHIYIPQLQSFQNIPRYAAYTFRGILKLKNVLGDGNVLFPLEGVALSMNLCRSGNRHCDQEWNWANGMMEDERLNGVRLWMPKWWVNSEAFQLLLLPKMWVMPHATIVGMRRNYVLRKATDPCRFMK